jgi:Cu(I)/Ag(I) efflux system periplasmic protein CusF
MNALKTLIAVAAFALSGVFSWAAIAQATASDMTEGEIRKIDKDAKKLTIKHGEIKNLDMPGMTMVFAVKDPAMVDIVKTGDKIRFKVERINGALTVTAIETTE